MDCQQEPGYNSFSCSAAVAKVGACSGSCWWSPTRTRYIFVLLPSRGSVLRVLVRVLVHICDTFDTFCIIHTHAQPGQHMLTISTTTMTRTISVICCHGWAGVRISQTCIKCHEYEQAPEQAPAKQYPGWAGAQLNSRFLLVTTNKNPNKHPHLLPRLGRNQN